MTASRSHLRPVPDRAPASAAGAVASPGPARPRELVRARRAARVVGVVLPLALTLASAAVLLAWLPRMPEPSATHWSLGGAPDGSGPPWTNAALSLGLGLGLIAMLSGLPLLDRARPDAVAPAWGATHRLLPAVGLATAVLVQGAALLTAAAQLDLDDWRAAPPVGAGLAACAAASLAAGTVGFLAQPRLRVEPGAAPGASPLPLAATERAVWVGTVRPSRPFAAVLLGAVAVLAGTAAWLAVAGVPAWWVNAAVAVLVAALAVASGWFRVRVDAGGLEARSLAGWPRARVPAAEVARVEAREIRPLAEFGGWGMRWLPGVGLGLVTRAGEGLVVTRRDGRILALTLDDAETAAGLLTAAAERSTT